MYLDAQVHEFPLVIVLGVELLDQNPFSKLLDQVIPSPAVSWQFPLIGASGSGLAVAVVSTLFYLLDTPIVSLFNF